MSLWLALALLALDSPDYVEQGRKALEANKSEEAAVLFTKAVEADRQDYAAHFHLALAESLLQRDEEAIVEYQKTLELKPKLYQAELNLGILLLRNKRAAEAIPSLTSAIAEKPAEYRPNFYLASALLESDKPAEAQPYFEGAIRSNPKSAGAEMGLARSLLRQNQLAQSGPHFENAAKLDPEYRDGLLELAAAQEKAGLKKEAAAIYQQFPENAAAQERLGELLIETNQFADAIPRLEKAVADSPTVANRLALATAYHMNKQLDKQDEQLAKAVALEPANLDLRLAYGRSLRDQRKLIPAANQFLAAARIKPDSKDAWNELASVLIVHQDYAQGLAALDKVKALGAESAGNYYLRAITLDKIHDKPGALASYKSFLAISDAHFPDQEFAARQRIRILQRELNKR